MARAANASRLSPPCCRSHAPPASCASARNDGVEVGFGRNDNQLSHTFRHVEAAGFNREAVQKPIISDLRSTASKLQDGSPLNQTITVSDGTVNVGRITTP